ncbi:hypothetical protein EYZ11_009027 [Aspergillus tanneri]|uniref:F-box domain-containing protein n=1 Tax=Aspergillus tanneri TaxID=1220188 RepID=A0A4S3J8Z1_9EURO|nr:uncharacterized protein ATNIH1004_002596 [Aspergillus tanneri]KAA8649917.1 hypothetical protein ATNIH1004_002596 [Aspergillus tanneri]THC91519.1 hypothetical protein EYZ11_009027 [Aspergillus tanneri]
MALLTLPLELLELITDNLTSLEDINSLVRTNRRLYGLFNDRLYRHDVHFFKSSALLWASEKGQLQTAKASLQAGADANSPDADGNTPLFLATCTGHSRIVQLLLDNTEVEPNWEHHFYHRSILGYASIFGYTSVVKILLDQHKNRISLESKDRAGQSALSLAAQHGHIEIVRLLLAQDGVDPNSGDMYDRGPLSLAAWYGHEQIVQVLLRVQGINAHARDAHGLTPLALAAWNGQAAVVELLVQQPGVDVNSHDIFNQSVLMLAVRRGQANVIQLLLDHGADPNAQDVNGRSNLSMAALYGHESVAHLFLSNPEWKVEADVEDVHGVTPLEVATRCCHTDMAAVLSSGFELEL